MKVLVAWISGLCPVFTSVVALFLEFKNLFLLPFFVLQSEVLIDLFLCIAESLPLGRVELEGLSDLDSISNLLFELLSVED